MEYYFTCCATFFSALLGLVFSFHTVRTSKGTAKANALYLLTRSIALVLISATPVLLQSLDVLIAITCAMLIVQTIDGAIGIYMKNRFRTIGPFVMAFLHAACLLWLYL